MTGLILSSKLLVIGRSVRMLAQMAVDAGYQPIAIDCFADQDTQSLALETLKVEDLSVVNIRSVVEAMANKHRLTHVAYGSGFEQHVESLNYLESRWVLIGNPTALFKRFQNKPAFFKHLQQLSIPYPDTVFVPPIDEGVWLVKPIRGEGGFGITQYQVGQTIDNNCYYWQRYLQGEVLSALFVAGLGKVRVLGFNRQWAVGNDRQRFVFAGVSNLADVSMQHRELIVEWLNKLITVYPLQGMGSLDFVIHNSQGYVLEVNARIPASAQLYGKSIFSVHCQVCLDGLEDVGQIQPAGFQIVFAENNLFIPAEIRWPEWVVDRPVSGSFIGKGEPVCSIIAAGNDANQVKVRLRHQQIIIENFLNTGHLNHAIPSERQ